MVLVIFKGTTVSMTSKSILELPEDMIIEILHRLPSKSLARFESVCKHWRKCIADPSLVYSCRSQRWSPDPYMIGFFCQSREEGCDQIRFFFSSRKSSEVIDGSLDESLDFLGNGVHIIASSNGFILITEDLFNQKVYYVYNPATRQCFCVPVTGTSRIKFAAIGFHCIADAPEKDVISFTIVRYEAFSNHRSSVTVESFSSETNMWSTIHLRLDVPLRVPLFRWTKLASAVVIDGVFCWRFDADLHIILYDSVYGRFWPLQLTEDMDDWNGCALGVSGGILYYALCNRAEITLWYLQGNIRSQDAIWVRKYVTNITTPLLNCPGDFGAPNFSTKMLNIHVHSADRHIFYLLVDDKVISYDSEKNIAELLYEIGVPGATAKSYYLFFSYEWYRWPRLLNTHRLEGL